MQHWLLDLALGVEVAPVGVEPGNGCGGFHVPYLIVYNAVKHRADSQAASFA
jgi:hypothetical protein